MLKNEQQLFLVCSSVSMTLNWSARLSALCVAMLLLETLNSDKKNMCWEKCSKNQFLFDPTNVDPPKLLIYLQEY